MRTIKSLFFIVLVLTMVICSGQVALALVGSSSGDTPSLTVYPNAAGTKYEGTLTLYFTKKVEYVVPGSDENLKCEILEDEGKCVFKDSEGILSKTFCYLIDNVCHKKESTDLMYIFLRLRKGSTWYPFSGIAEGTVYTNISAQNAAVELFVEQNVIPVIYRGVDPLPKALLKSVAQIVSDNESLTEGEGCCNEMEFVILDVVIAVQD